LAACFLAVPGGDVLAAAGRALADIASGQLRIIGSGDVGSITDSARGREVTTQRVCGFLA
jgi:hypothetical protein